MTLLKAYILSFILCVCSTYVAAQALLVPWFDTATGWYGYANQHGEVVIPPQWANAYFFEGNRALVVPDRQPKYTPQYFAQIDRDGKYLIPPERRWVFRDSSNGQQFQLNCYDSLGRWGWVNEHNELLIPYVWDRPKYDRDQQMADTLMVVTRTGLAGVIDYRGNIVLPCLYGHVQVVTKLYRETGCFIVTDANDPQGPNNKGIVLANGETVVPMKYKDIEYISIPHRGFRLVFDAYEGKPYGKWAVLQFMYFDTKQIVPWQEEKFLSRRVIANSNYYLKGVAGNYTLCDISGNVKMSRVANVEGDTIITEISYEHRSDSAIHTTSRYRLPSLQLVQKIQQFGWIKPYENLFPRFVCGTGRNMFRSQSFHPADEVSLPEHFYNFYKDSFKFSAHKALVHRRDHPVSRDGNRWKLGPTPKVEGYLVQGENRIAGNTTVFAIVDDSMNYLLPPFSASYVYFVNLHDSIIGLNEGMYHFGRKGLGNRIEANGGQQSVNCFRYKDRLYKYFGAADYRPASMRSVFGTDGNIVVGDTLGLLKGQWQYCSWQKDAVPGLFGQDTVAFWAKDTAGYMTLLDPDGNELLPWLSGKYKVVTAYGKLLLTENRMRERTLLCKNGDELVPGCKVWEVNATGLVHKPYDEQNNDIAMFYRVNSTMPSGNTGLFYVDAAGRAYTSASRLREASGRARKSKKQAR